MQKISAKLVQIMDEVAYISKKGKNEYHNYSYATSAEVLEKVNKALVKHNVCAVVLPELINITDVTTSKGNIEHLATVKVEIKLIDATSGESIIISGMGSGQDAGDKAIMKAQSAAIKYAYILSLAICLGNGEESRPRKNESLICTICECTLSNGVATVSRQKYGELLCMKCQKEKATLS